MPAQKPESILPIDNAILVADSISNCIFKYSFKDQKSYVYAGGEAGNVDGPIASSKLRAPCGLCMSDDKKLVFVVERDSHLIKCICNGKI